MVALKFELVVGNMDARILLCLVAWLLLFSEGSAQSEVVKLAQTKEEYIKKNHVEDIEDIVHQFMKSRQFLTFLLEQGHDIEPDEVNIKRKDVSVGEDLDIYVKHITEHQNFTLLLVPISIYDLAIYDTLLFSVIEVSDEWMEDRFFNSDLEDPEVKAHLLTIENHTLLSTHMYDQALKNLFGDVTEVEISLHEGYISSSNINMHVSDLDSNEKKQLRRRWGFMKKVFTHNINLNVEMNVYIFGYDDMEVSYVTKSGKKTFKITPQNIFTRHEFAEDTDF